MSIERTAGAAQAERMDSAARSRRYREVAADLTALLLREFPDDIHAVVLFGSVARGEAHELSDVDLLVITDADHETHRRMWDVADDVYWDRFQTHDEHIPFGLLRLTTAGFEKEAITYRSYLAQDIMEQGVVFYDDGAYQSICNKANGTGSRVSG